MKSRWVKHNDKRVLIADFSNYGSDASAIRTETDFIKSFLLEEMPSSVRAITLVEGTYGTPDVIQALSELLPVSNKYVLMRALVGLSGFRKYFVEAFTKLAGAVQFKQFDTVAEALEWVTSN